MRTGVVYWEWGLEIGLEIEDYKTEMVVYWEWRLQIRIKIED